MVRLVLDLLAARAAGGPVPVLAPIASWDPSGQDLRDWLATRLITDYPALAGPSPAGATGPDRAAALIEAGLILPVLDGLDEIPEKVRAAAISRINDALSPGGQVLLTCRTRQYRDAVRPPGGPEVTLTGAAAIQLRPLDADAVCRYLRDDAPGPAARARWDPVLPLLGTSASAGEALSTPLMVGLARTIYNPRPGETAGTLRDPAELSGFSSRAAVEAHLFDAFIPAAYRVAAGRRWTAGRAEQWLTFLARHLEYTIGTPDLAWWQLDKAVSRTSLGLGLGLAAGLAAGLGVGLVAGPGFGLVAGPGFGLVVGLAVGPGVRRGGRPELPARGVRISTAGLGLGLVTGLGFGLGAGLAAGLLFGLTAGLGAGLAVGLVFGLGAGLISVPRDIEGTIDPRMVLARDRQVMLFLTLGAGLGAGLTAGLGAGLAAGFTTGLGAGLGVGLGAGFTAGLCAGLDRTRWTSYVLVRGWLAFHRQLPWPLMAFLADAHQRGVLRQAGATYQFRHLELQHRLATRP